MEKHLTKSVIILLLAFLLASCTKSNPTPNKNSKSGGGNGTGTSNGNVAFWTSQATGWSSINVYFNNVLVGTTSTYFTATPNCGADGTITMSKPPGTYAFTASSNTGTTWSGTVAVTAGACNTQRLDFPSGGSNGGGGNSGSNTAPGLVFWTSKSSGWSSINIYQQTGIITGTIIGNSYVILIGTISGTYFNSTPGCGAAGAVTTTLPTVVFPSPYYAKSNTGITWSNIQVFADKPRTCSNVRLDFPTDGSTNGTVVYEQGQ